jgi:hypothetical protein
MGHSKCTDRARREARRLFFLEIGLGMHSLAKWFLQEKKLSRGCFA